MGFLTTSSQPLSRCAHEKQGGVGGFGSIGEEGRGERSRGPSAAKRGASSDRISEGRDIEEGVGRYVCVGITELSGGLASLCLGVSTGLSRVLWFSVLALIANERVAGLLNRRA